MTSEPSDSGSEITDESPWVPVLSQPLQFRVSVCFEQSGLLKENTAELERRFGKCFLNSGKELRHVIFIDTGKEPGPGLILAPVFYLGGSALLSFSLMKRISSPYLIRHSRMPTLTRANSPAFTRRRIVLG